MKLWPFGKSRVQEAMPPMGAVDPDINLSASQGGSPYYRRLTQSQRDLPQLAADRARQIAFWLWTSTPIGKRAPEYVASCVVGDGVIVSATEKEDAAKEQLQTAIDRFWDAEENHLGDAFGEKVMELGLWGEQIYSVVVNPVDGHVSLGYIDPDNVKAVVTDPKNAERKIEVVLREEPGKEPERLKIIERDPNPDSPTFGRLVGNVEGDGYVGSCFHFAVNALSNQSRGYSDLMCVADWIDGHDQFQFGELDRHMLAKSFIYDVAYQGASDADIDKYAKEIGSGPKPGTVRVHNDRVTWQAVSPSLNSMDAQVMADALISMIATGVGLPKTWFQDTAEVNKATAQELSEPALKFLQSRQTYVKYIVRHMVTFALDQAELANKLPMRQAGAGLLPEAWNFAVEMPELRPKDEGLQSTTFQNIVTACHMAVEDGALDTETYRRIIAAQVTGLGVEVTVEEIAERADVEMAEREAKQAEQFKQQQALAQQNRQPRTLTPPRVREDVRLPEALEEQIREVVNRVPDAPPYEKPVRVRRTLIRNDAGQVVSIEEEPIDAV